MAYPMPLVVPKRSSAVLGAGVQRVPLTLEINAQSRADIHSMLVGITREDTSEQIRLGNPPQVVEVDGNTGKALEQVEKRSVVLFGTTLAKAAMLVVETVLRQAIMRTTTSRTGRLQNVGSTWEWLYVQRNGAAQKVTSASPPTTFQQGDQLVLRPVAVPYASAVNRAVANAGRSNDFVKSKIRGKKVMLAKSAQNLGFLGATTWVLKRRAEFTNFKIVAVHTTDFPVPGEGRKHGTGIIVITPRKRTR
jgi:hypothetical protein